MNEDILILSLHHIITLRSETRDVAVYIDRLLVLDALEHRVDYNKAAGTSNASAAMNDQRSGVLGIEVAHSAQELQERRRMLRHAMVGPSRELQLLDLATLRVAMPTNL